MRAFLLVLALAAGFDAAADHLLCLAEDGNIRPPQGCIAQTRLAPVPPAAVPRKFAFIKESANQIILGVLPANETLVDVSIGPMFSFGYDLPGQSSGTVALTDSNLGTWTLTLDAAWFAEGRLNVNVPRGSKWDYVVTRDGKVLDTRTGFSFPNRRPGSSGRVSLKGRAVSATGSAADFAELTADCRRVLCTAEADGSFRCDAPFPEDGALCVEHPRFGRKRIELQTRSGEIDLGVVELVPGSTIRVIKPLHVELPAGTTVSLLQKRRALGEPQPLSSRSILEFPGLAAGKYNVLLAGPDPLQRKLFNVEVAADALAEVQLNIEPYRLTGEVEYRKKPLAGATVALDGDAWKGELEADQSGRFDAELWSPGEYGVSVSAPALVQPYLVMKRVSEADSHWRFTVPSRRITGRVFDAETGRPVEGASLQVTSDSSETRTSRNVELRDDGTFVYDGADVGTFGVEAMASGYAQGEPLRLSVRDGDGDLAVDVPLARAAQVQVTVVDAQLRPVAGAAVLSDFGPNGALKGVRRTRPDGTLVVTVPERGIQPVYIVTGSSLATVRLTARDGESGVRVALPEGVAALHVNATSSEGDPLAGIGIALRYGGQEIPAGVVNMMTRERRAAAATDAAGNLRLIGLPAGEYEIGWMQKGAPRPVGWRRLTLGAGETKVSQSFRSKSGP
jgi:hypothetical protein